MPISSAVRIAIVVPLCLGIGLACSGETDSTSSSGGAGGSGGSGMAGAGGSSCPSGQKWCTDACRPADDPAYGCGTGACDPCLLPNADAKCQSGGCVVSSCSSSYADCDGDSVNGCEANLASDAHHCGSCAVDCFTHLGPGSICNDSQCATNGGPSCTDIGRADCDGVKDNGCEVDTLTDVANCGACGKACAAGQGCVDGVCQ